MEFRLSFIEPLTKRFDPWFLLPLTRRFVSMRMTTVYFSLIFRLNHSWQLTECSIAIIRHPGGLPEQLSIFKRLYSFSNLNSNIFGSHLHRFCHSVRTVLIRHFHTISIYRWGPRWVPDVSSSVVL